MEFKENIVLGGTRKEHSEYGPATGLLCWVYEVSGDLYLTRLSGLMGSEADSRAGDPCSFPRREHPQFSYCKASLKKQEGRYRRTNLVFWVAGSFFGWGGGRRGRDCLTLESVSALSTYWMDTGECRGMVRQRKMSSKGTRILKLKRWSSLRYGKGQRSGYDFQLPLLKLWFDSPGLPNSIYFIAT